MGIDDLNLTWEAPAIRRLEPLPRVTAVPDCREVTRQAWALTIAAGLVLGGGAAWVGVTVYDKVTGRKR